MKLKFKQHKQDEHKIEIWTECNTRYVFAKVLCAVVHRDDLFYSTKTIEESSKINLIKEHFDTYKEIEVDLVPFLGVEKDG